MMDLTKKHKLNEYEETYLRVCNNLDSLLTYVLIDHDTGYTVTYSVPTYGDENARTVLKYLKKCMNDKMLKDGSDPHGVYPDYY